MVCGVALLAASSVAAQPAPKPNIVFILADDLGIGDTGITHQNARAEQGLPSFATPNIDSIALSGARFSNMYAGGQNCSPSRATLLTGFHQRHGIFEQGISQPSLRGGDEDKTWGQLLQDDGYETGMFGKWHLGAFNPQGTEIRTPSALPTQKGFETAYGPMLRDYRMSFHWENDGTGGMRKVLTPTEPTWTGTGEKNVYGETLVAQRAVNFIREKANGAEPFAAYIPFMATHDPIDQVPKDHPYINMPWPQIQRDYAGTIWYLDKHVGQILQALDDPNNDGNTADSVADNTIVMFASDNGPLIWGTPSGFNPEFFNSNINYYGYKNMTTEGGIRTPFFVRWPEKIAPGTQNNVFGSFADIMPTLAELTGQEAPLGIDGRSMLSEWTGEGPSQRPDVMAWGMSREIGPGNPASSTIRVGPWKLTKNQPTSTNPNITYWLFNIANDPGETVNWANAKPNIRIALEQILIAEGADREPYAPLAENPAIIGRINTYFSQYKTWSPQAGSTNFFSAANWSGGTQYDYTPGQPEANNWNTGPADNWLATMRNASGVDQQVTLNANAQVLALELRGVTSAMALRVNAGVQLAARNGLRISDRGILRLRGGEINTVRDIEVRPGGRFDGEGLINGQQAVLAGISDFANLGLLEPHLINGGVVAVTSEGDPSFNAGRLLVQGDYTQTSTGVLQMDVYSTGGVAGLNFDQLAVTGKVKLAGVLSVSANNPQGYALGNVFPLITSGGGLSGTFASLVAPALSPGLAWTVDYSATSATLKVVAQAGDNYLIRWKQSFGVNAAADIDGDGDTDGADLLAWQRGEAAAATTMLPYLTLWRQSLGVSGAADLDGDNDTDGHDLMIWQRGGGLGQPAFSAIPEPALAPMLIAALGALTARRRRCQSAAYSHDG